MVRIYQKQIFFNFPTTFRHTPDRKRAPLYKKNIFGVLACGITQVCAPKIFFSYSGNLWCSGGVLGRSLKITKKKIVLVSPAVNSGEKERLQLRNFVLIGRPNEHVLKWQYMLIGPYTAISFFLRQNIFIDREAREIMHLVASVCPSVRLSVRPSVRPSVCNALLLEPFDLWPSFLALGLTLT